MRYFFLNPECYLVKGVLRGALYNLHSGDVFSVDPQLGALLSRCDEERKPLDEAINSIDTPREEVLEALSQLKKENIGRFYEVKNTPPIIEKLKPSETIKQRNPYAQSKLASLHFELTGECNLDCIYCERDSTQVRKKTGCARWPANHTLTKLHLDDWKQIIVDAEKLGCVTLTFTGAEPLLAWDDLSALIISARNNGFEEITIETNGTLLDEQKIHFLKQHDIVINLQIFSFKESIHDGITKTPGSFAAMMKNLELMFEHELKFMFTLPIIDDNGDHVQDTVEWFEGYEPAKIIFDVIFPKGKDDFTHVSMGHLDSIYRTARHPFRKVSPQSFCNQIEAHSCFRKKLAITCYGEVLPCPMAREEIMGHIPAEDLISLLLHKNACNEFWFLTKDKVKVCQDCEYRYACFDCRPIEKGLSGDLLGRSELCTYDPYKGQWASIPPHILNEWGNHKTTETTC